MKFLQSRVEVGVLLHPSGSGVWIRMKSKWKCPHCSQTCGRRWNLKVHINRKHHGSGSGTSTIRSTEHILWDGSSDVDLNNYEDPRKMPYENTGYRDYLRSKPKNQETGMSFLKPIVDTEK